MKTCTVCGRLLDESMFYKDRTKKDGLAYDCKDCRKAYMIKKYPKKEETKTVKQRTCIVCGELFTPQIKENGKPSESNYCSEECYNKKYHTKICIICNRSFVEPKLDNGNYSKSKICIDCQENKCNSFKKIPLPNKIECVYCHKYFYPEYLPNSKRYSRSKYCSDECYKKDVLPPRKCLVCGKDILDYDDKGHLRRDKKYCCDTCQSIAIKNQRKLRYCKCCGKIITEERKASKFCSDICARKYEIEHTQKYFCKVCGKEICMYDSNFNRLSRSKTYCSQACYKSDLKTKYYDKYNNLVCAYCGKTYSLQTSNYNNQSIYRGSNYYKYCSKACADSAREEKKKQTCLVKYGKDYVSRVASFRTKAENTMLAKYGVKYSCLLPQTIEANKHTISNLNKNFMAILCDVSTYVENETAFFEFVLDSYNYDIGLPQIKTVIEINPTYTHSVLPSHWDLMSGQDYGKSEFYHLNRTNKALDKNYRCIHVWQWDNWNKIIDLLSVKQRLYARKLQLKEISKQEANEFLDLYHLQNSCRGNSINLGLYQNEELIQVMTFGKPRYNKNYEWELLRLCTKTGYYVVGGAERLFKHFIKTQNPESESVISYCDISKFKGDVYECLGFKLVNQTKPQKIWSKDNNFITDNLLRQRGADQLIGTHDGKGTDNEEIMIREGWRPVYDCGQKVFKY